MTSPESKRWLFGCLIPGGAVITAGSIMGALAFGRMFEGCELDLGPSEPRTLAGVDARSGNQEWSRRFRGPGLVQVGGATDELVVFRDPHFSVRVINLADGTDVWTAEPEGGAASIPVLHDGAVIVIGCDQALYAYDVTTGTQRWRTEAAVAGEDIWETSGLGYRSLGLGVVASNGVIVTAGVGDPVIRAFDIASGAALWQAPLFGGVRDAPVVSGEHVLVTDETATTYAFDLATGAVAWGRPDERAQDYLTTELVPAGEVVGIPDIDPQGGSTETIFVDATTGAEQWRTTAPNFGPFGHGVFAYDQASRVLYESPGVLNENGTIARDASTGTTLRTITNAEAEAILVAGGSVVIEEDEVQAFDGSTGEPLWSAYEGWDEARPSAYADGLVVVTLGEELDTEG
jgi:outer membrane protein assembly factor BamB